ncbi:MAG: hypothetical protein WBG86_21340 [Polyangiales bacterium]
MDLASGGGRHARYLRGLGLRVVAVDRDTSRLADLVGDPEVERIEADLEGEAWPLEGRQFSAVVVTNYLYRPRLASLVDLIVPNGLLIYETFAEGHERVGRPRNPDYLLRPGELLDVFSPALSIIAHEHGIEEQPRPAVRQRICGRKRSL